MKKELWKDITQNNKYMVSSFWRIKKKSYIKYWKNGSFRYEKPEKLINPVSKNYARVSIDKKLFSVHRIVAQEFLWLDINDKSIYVCHIDDNKLNNNVDNLFLWRAIENSADMVNKWRWRWNLKLKQNEVIDIKSLISKWNHTHKELANIFWVSRSCISMIACWKNFNHITI